MALRTITRRSMLIGSLGLGAGAALAGCAGDTADGKSDGEWTYSDDRGRTVTLDRQPQRIVAQVSAAAALWDFGVRPVGIFGPSKRTDGSRDAQVGSVDLNKVTSLGNTFGEFNIESYVGLNPDLLISVLYGSDDLWYVPQESAKAVDAVADSIGIELSKIDLVDAIGKFAALAKSLGADTNASIVTDAKAAFDAADSKLGEAAAKAKDLRVLVVSSNATAPYIAIPEYYPNLRHFAKRGVSLIVPDKPDQTGFWETVSWENVAKYPADVILYDARTQALTTDQLASKPVWAAMPAVKANQITPWYSEAQYSYQGYTDQLNRLATDLGRFQRVS